jgi:hypothetical protein
MSRKVPGGLIQAATPVLDRRPETCRSMAEELP